MLNRLRARVSSTIDRVRNARSSRAGRNVVGGMRRAASAADGRQSGS